MIGGTREGFILGYREKIIFMGREILGAILTIVFACRRLFFPGVRGMGIMILTTAGLMGGEGVLLTTLGLYGGVIFLESRSDQWIELKNSWFLTALKPLSPAPSRLLRSLCNSCMKHIKSKLIFIFRNPGNQSK